MLKKIGIIILLSTMALSAFSQAKVLAELDLPTYKAGDLVKVRISLLDNPGLHNLFFYLHYDDNVLAFERIRGGSLGRWESGSELLYADNSLSEGFTESKVVVSFAMNEPDASTSQEGTVADIFFRVLGQDSQSHSFRFSDCAIRDTENNQLAADFVSSPFFTITSPFAGEFIKISRPYDNMVVSNPRIPVSLICSRGNYRVRLINTTTTEEWGDFTVTTGRLYNHEEIDTNVDLVPGVNKIKAELFDSSFNSLTSHSVRVYYSAGSDNLTITEPMDHALLNTDTVVVKVDSTLKNILINGQPATREHDSFSRRVQLKNGFNTIKATGRKSNILYQHHTNDAADTTRLNDSSAAWQPDEYAGYFLEINGYFALILSNGQDNLNLSDANYSGDLSGESYRIRSSRDFGGDEAEAVFTDEILVFYQKDSRLFRFLAPEENRGFKAGAYASLAINGEIDSLYQPLTDPLNFSYEPNEVTLEVIHHPYNALLPEKMLVKESDRVIITETEAGSQATSPYVFYLEEEASLAGLSDGEIEITAYKNKNGNVWDDKISRFVYIDNQRLWINLVQPNVYAEELLDSREKIEKFNGPNGTAITTPGIHISAEGEIGLAAQDPALEIQEIGHIKAMAEAPDGTLYALVNQFSSQMEIYEKDLKETNWHLLLSQSGLHGYDIEFSDIGLLVGASNIPSNGNSGLYLVNDETLININLQGCKLNSVEFIDTLNHKIFLYGSLFKDLIAFQTSALQESEGVLSTSEYETTAFSNTLSILDFILTADGKCAILRSDESEGNIHFYEKSGTQFLERNLPPLHDSHLVTGRSITYGPYAESGYEAFVIPQGSSKLEVLMRNLATGDLFRREVDIAASADFCSRSFDKLAGTGFSRDQFQFLYEYESPGSGRYEYFIEQGKVFFNRFIADADFTGDTYTRANEGSIGKEQQKIWASSLGSFYIGLNPAACTDPVDMNTYHLYKKNASAAGVNFDYYNEDIEGLSGFSFEVDPLWLENPGLINFGFKTLRKLPGDTEEELSLSLPEQDLRGLLDALDGQNFSNEYYDLSHYFDTTSENERITCQFKNLLEGKDGEMVFLRFYLSFSGEGQQSPEIKTLEVFKKIKAKIASGGDDEMNLPVQGFVYDRTVKEVSLYKGTVLVDRSPVGPNGSFNLNLKLDSSRDRQTAVTVRCENVLGDEAEVSFAIEIVTSENDLWDMAYSFSGEPAQELGFSRINTNERNVTITGSYLGLAGLMVGWELRARDAVGTLLSQGTFQRTPAADPARYSGRADLLTGYEAGGFSGAIRLHPNAQDMLIYLENPGGKRYYFASGEGDYPDFVYTMPQSEQEIIFDTELHIEEDTLGNNIPVGDRIEFKARESEEEPWVFTAHDVILGEIKALEQFDEILVKSYTPGLSFDGNDEMIIQVEPGNRFALPFTVRMGNNVSTSYYLAVFPTIPVYNYLKKGIRLDVSKEFENTHFIPDFSPLAPENWSQEQQETLRNIPILFTMNREDLPLQGQTTARLSVNFAESFTGTVVAMDAEHYGLHDAEGKVMDLANINRGRNRIQWSLEYHEPLTTNTVTMSSSQLGREGMDDYTFLLVDEEQPAPTVLTFTPALQGIYYDNTDPELTALHLPGITITKDPTSKVTLTLNGSNLLTLPAESSGVTDFMLDPASHPGLIKEGRNRLEMENIEKYQITPQTESYNFLYDSRTPVVKIASLKTAANHSLITGITAIVEEANFNRAYLHYSGDILNREPLITPTGNATYLLQWNGLALDSAAAIYVEARDRSGKSESAEVDAFNDTITRPGTVEIREQEIPLPLYTGEPAIGNEINRETRPFPDHTKFAPAQMLEQISVKDVIEENGGRLIENLNCYQVRIPDGENHGFYNNFVAVSGNSAVVGVYWEDSGTDDPIDNTGAAHIYERQSDGNWREVAILHASDGQTGDYFGSSAAISGDYALIGAHNEDGGSGNPLTNSGAAYIYERQSDGTWEEVDILHASDAQAEDWFGTNLAISGDYAIIEAWSLQSASQKAYIFERQSDGTWQEVDLLHTSHAEAYDNSNHVAISGDYAIMGAPFENSGSGVAYSGAAYIFERQSDGLWQEVKNLHASDAQANDNFGHVAISENYAIVGALHEDGGTGNPIINCGAAYVFERRSDGTWEEVDILHASDAQASDFFGNSIAISGDYAIIGAYAEDGGTGSPLTNSGAAYIYMRQPNGTWVEIDSLHASNGDAFGNFVAISGENFVIGNRYIHGNGTDSCAAYIYNKGITGFQDELSDNSLIDEQEKKYLVFQIRKDQVMNTSEDLQIDGENIIRFEVYGYEQDPSTGTLTKKSPEPDDSDYFITTTDHEHMVQGLNYLYYMVELDYLKSQFITSANMIVFDEENHFISNKGTLRIRYHENLNDFTPADIYVTGESSSNWQDIIVHDAGYEGSDSGQGYMNLAAGLSHPLLDAANPEEDRSGVFNHASPAKTLAFWLRIEDENAMDSYYAETSKRLLTFQGSQGEELIYLEYQGNEINFFDNTQTTPRDLLGSPLPLDLGLVNELTRMNTWNLIMLSFEEANHTITLSLGNPMSGLNQTEIVIPDTSLLPRLLEAGASFYFGPEVEGFNTGFFSVAHPFFIDRLLEDTEIIRLANLYDQNPGSESFYGFNFPGDGYGAGAGDLRAIGGSDSFRGDQNADYNADNGSGALKGSGVHANFFKTIHDDTGEYVILGEADSAVYYDLVPRGGDGQFSLNLAPEATEGTYYFGNKHSNYGLGTDRWYSLSGEVLALEDTATLVMRLNGREERFELYEGTFHFVYENPGQVIPSDLKVYIEATGDMRLSNDLSLNQGNFKLPVSEGFARSAASTTFAFNYEGSLDLWYKPFILNDGGTLSRDVVILDSELVKIGARRNGDEPATYYALIYGEEESECIALNTSLEASPHWTHLQVAWGGENESKVVYFYINGDVAAYKENLTSFPDFGSLAGDIDLENPEDNVFLGCSKDRSLFAGGYLDDIFISKYYSPPVYSNRRPAELVFESATGTIHLNPLAPVQAEDISNTSYRITATGCDGFTEGTSFPVQTSHLDAGRYKLSACMNIRGYAYRDDITFNIDRRPGFSLSDHTPLLFAGEPTELFFTFDYDNSYLFNTDELRYAGLGLKVVDEEGTVMKQVYLTQNFQNQDPGTWIRGVSENGEITDWTLLEPMNNGQLKLSFPDFTSSSNLEASIDYFYFTDDGADIPGFSADSGVSIPQAALAPPQILSSTVLSNTYQYLVKVGLTCNDSYNSIFEEISIEYDALRLADGLKLNGEASLERRDGDPALKAYFYYDDIFGDAFGTYEVTFRLRYNNITYATQSETLVWKKIAPKKSEENVLLEIDEFTLCYLDKKNGTADFYVQWQARGVGNIDLDLNVRCGGQEYSSCGKTGLVNSLGYDFVNNVPIPEEGVYYVKVTLAAQDTNIDPNTYFRSAYLELENKQEVLRPEILLTNSVESRIPYNDVHFSWKGFVMDEEGNRNYDSTVEYSYSFDSFCLANQEKALWSTWSPNWRNVRYYNLEDGFHSFYVKARYNDMETKPLGSTFFVDIHPPVFDTSLMTIEKNYDNQGVLDSVSLYGEVGALKDASLSVLTINTGQEVLFNEDGSFSIPTIPITEEGITELVLTAFDSVGNYSTQSFCVENTIISEILFPAEENNIIYSPLTIVGKLSPSIRAGLRIYAQDVSVPDTSPGNYEGWKQGVINPDRTFFIENIMVNPGKEDQRVQSSVKLRLVFENGKTFERDLQVFAKEILLPIEMSLSAHAVEGESQATEVVIHCQANVKGISSWSVDYDGDGIYDEIDLTANPLAPEAQAAEWTHIYSHIGQVTPRVRVVTTDGNFFSVSDNLIIHERIREASHKLIGNPLSLSVCGMPDNSQRVYVLRGTGGDYSADVFEIGRNENFISSKPYKINLTALGIENPVLLRALDHEHLIVVTESAGSSGLLELVSDDYGHFSLAASLELPGEVRDLSLDQEALYVSFKNRNYFMEIPLTERNIPDSLEQDFIKLPQMRDAIGIGENSSLTHDDLGFLVADYYNQRVVRLTDSYNLLEQYGTFGVGEQEFLTPTWIRNFGGRVFVYDETRSDIQVFDLFQQKSGALDNRFVPVCQLDYDTTRESGNYLEEGFFNRVADLAVVTRTEGTRQYFYALILSQSAEKLAMLRIPQFEELRAKVRNNKIAFIRDGEIFTAKPDSSDLKKILSSDSLPRVEGALDYPALSPDGKLLVFTSRLDLYIGKFSELENTGNPYAYDQLYIYDIESRELKRLSLGEWEGLEIERPVFNSNGDTLIFSGKAYGQRWQIYTWEMKNREVNRLFESEENARYPFYSPDDRFIVFSTDYDGDEDIMIIDTLNLNMRVAVTNNDARDSLPVWINVYPGEIANPDYKIESKIAYISERGFEKNLYSVYLSRPSESDIRVVTDHGLETGSDPDTAAGTPITPPGEEGDYPCFVGDSKGMVFENYNGVLDELKFYDYTDDTSEVMSSFQRARRPAGMKNSITFFEAENVNGNELRLSWERYTDKDIFYTVQFKPAGTTDPHTEKQVFSQESTHLEGLQMGTDYLVRVCIIEDNEVAASTQWKTVSIPQVVAKPSYEIDPENPYLVNLHSWKPEETVNSDSWFFSWIIDNNEILVQKSQDYSYEFATSGEKIIQLKAYTQNHDYVHISDPLFLKIESDIEPVIDYVLAEDGSYLKLSAENSPGKKIDFPSTSWTISGPGGGIQQYSGSTAIADLGVFSRKVNVTLSLRRQGVNGQSSTDIRSLSRVIDLDYRELKPVITTWPDAEDKQLIHFSGRDSFGNIDWFRANWTIFAGDKQLYEKNGMATFDYRFPESNKTGVYTVSLTVPSRGDGLSQSISRVVSVEPAPLQPVIKSEVLELTKDGEVIGSKILFDCSESMGSGIDFNAARWSIPSAGNFGEQPVQAGPVAVYNLIGIADTAVIEVALTLTRQGGLDAKTVTRNISISGEVPGTSQLVVNKNFLDTSEGQVLFLDVLKSTGPNILWEKTDWLIDNQYIRQGPSVRYEIPARGEDKKIAYRCTLYRLGGTPEVVDGTVDISGTEIEPVLNITDVAEAGNVKRMDVLSSRGLNIDWERTRWYIHDGSQEVVVKQGADITHAFALRQDQFDYPVVVEMFMQNDTLPFVEYKAVSVDGDTFTPLITTSEDYDATAANGAIRLSAESSVGSNIDWTQSKWTILETAETFFGPVVSYPFPVSARKSYTVLLTLFRRLADGQVESKTVQKRIHVIPDAITPSVKAWVETDNEGNKTLMLSAENSSGLGLLLDRAVWAFPGEGDSISENISTKSGTLVTNNLNVGGGVNATVGVRSGVNPPYNWLVYYEGYFDVSANTHVGDEYNRIDYSGDYADKTDSLSSSNYHTGPICRRAIKEGQKNQIVTLFVYRTTPEGGVDGTSITVDIPVNKLSSEAVDYE